MKKIVGNQLDVLKLLRSKNRCLMKFLEKSKTFYVLAQQGDLSELQQFLDYRETSLKVVSLYDNHIMSAIEQLTEDKKTISLIQSLKHEQDLNENLVRSILKMDQDIISRVEEERNRLRQEISSSEKSTQLVKKFRSRWISEPGDNLDGKL